MSRIPHILIVDDEIFNIEIIIEMLDESDYRLSSATDSFLALEMLESEPESYDVILLDRMMPKMDGMEFLRKIKKHKTLKHISVIFQTAMSSNIEISEGLNAGAHYYLTKPFEENVLKSVINTAVRDRLRYKEFQKDLDKNRIVMGLLKSAHFEFKTIEEARNIAGLVSHAFPEPTQTVMGLTELMINAIEHGNLGISYSEKTMLNNNQEWSGEVERRLKLPQNMNKRASLICRFTDEVLELFIADDGDGFDWQKYMDFDPERVMDNHGRGIALANQVSFSEVEYSGSGNEVCARLIIN